MDEETKTIIETAMYSEEFIQGLSESVDWFDVVERAYKTNNVILLNSIKEMLERRITELNIKFWFIRIETVENNILNELLN